jgi:hypothetical protein
MQCLADSPWWRAVFFDQIGAALIGGLVAVIVAAVTVRFTLRGEREAMEHQLERQQDFAVQDHRRQEEFALLQQSRQAAGVLNAALLKVVRWLRDDQDPALPEWIDVELLNMPLITDPELQGMLDDFTAGLTNYAMWREERPQLNDPDPISTPTREQWNLEARQQTEALASWIGWLGPSLAAHRRSMPLPARPADLPFLPHHDLRV